MTHTIYINGTVDIVKNTTEEPTIPDEPQETSNNIAFSSNADLQTFILNINITEKNGITLLIFLKINGMNTNKNKYIQIN